MSKQLLTVLYPGTFDPITAGHLDIIERASKMFGSIIVAVGENHEKKPTFNAHERRDMIIQSCKHLDNVQVEIFSGLAVDFARKVGANALVRGLRTEADFMYELQMAIMNRSLDNSLETLFIPTRQDLSHISSSLLKGVAKLGGNIKGLVPDQVLNQMLAKFKG